MAVGKSGLALLSSADRLNSYKIKPEAPFPGERKALGLVSPYVSFYCFPFFFLSDIHTKKVRKVPPGLPSSVSDNMPVCCFGGGTGCLRWSRLCRNKPGRCPLFPMAEMSKKTTFGNERLPVFRNAEIVPLSFPRCQHTCQGRVISPQSANKQPKKNPKNNFNNCELKSAAGGRAGIFTPTESRCVQG